MRRLCLAPLAVLVVTSAVAAQPRAAASILNGELGALAAAARVRHEMPALSVAVRQPDAAVRAAAFGLLDVENQVPATPDGMFRLASISKPITAVIAARLAERGALDLDRPLAEFVDGWEAKQWPVTTRLLLGHLGGVRHYAAGSDEIRSNRHYDTVASALAIFADDPLLHEPGRRYRYSTYGFNLAGVACVAASGADFRSLLRDEVVQPAGLPALRYDDQDAIIRHRAQGYRRAGDGTLRNAAPVDTSNKVPGGGMLATATDLVLFADALLEDRLLPRARRDAMWTGMETAAGESTGYGMGFGVRGGPEQEQWIVLHGGAQPRVSTLLWIDPRRELAVALMTNLEGQGRALRSLASTLADTAADGD